MSVCRKCGHELGIGRFCTNCGHPVDAPVETPVDTGSDPGSDTLSDAVDASRGDESGDPGWSTGTAERPAVAASPTPSPPPPPVHPVTESARYPLYADEVAPEPPPDAPPMPSQHAAPQSHRAGAPWLPWAVGAVVLVLVVVLGALLLFGGDDPPASVGTEPDDAGSGGSAGQSNAVTREATATVPATAPPNQDTEGNPVNYDARNMLDGVPETCWRMPGDGSGQVITLELAEPTTVTSVGLINGYAKTARDGAATLNWYTGNRRVMAVEWTFDDGTTVGQDLEETRSVQSVDVDPVETSTIELRLVEVSAPGTGPAARDYTAISDIALVGTAS